MHLCIFLRDASVSMYSPPSRNVEIFIFTFRNKCQSLRVNPLSRVRQDVFVCPCVYILCREKCLYVYSIEKGGRVRIYLCAS